MGKAVFIIEVTLTHLVYLLAGAFWHHPRQLQEVFVSAFGSSPGD
jgi:hypothetical protein